MNATVIELNRKSLVVKTNSGKYIEVKASAEVVSQSMVGDRAVLSGGQVLVTYCQY